MFQNIYSDYMEDTEYEDVESRKKYNLKNIANQIFTKQNIILYIISFMISTVGFGQNMAPFGIAILASAWSNKIPIGIIYILTCIGNLIGFGKDSALLYMLASFIFIGLNLVIKPKINEIDGTRKLGVHVGVACFIVQAGKMFFDTFLIYDLLESVLYSISVCIFYKIFSGSIKVIKDLGIKKAFSVEEVIGASLIVAIAVAGFKDFAIFGFSVKNIFSILIVLILGWQNGVLVGATAGITIGVVLGIIGNGNPVQVASYALSGMIAGLLNKIGKIGVIAGFIIGNGILTYVANGNTTTVILLQEILIASIGLLAVPKNVKIDIEDLFGKDKYLPKAPEKRLEQNEDAIYKLNSVSEAISEVAQTYKEVAASIVEEKEESILNRNIFVKELKNNITKLEDNILYDDILEEENTILEDIFNLLIKNDCIIEKQLIDIFEKHNNYIIGFDDNKSNSKIDSDIRDMVKVINYSYRISKINFIWERKINENKKTMSSQLDGISKAISSIADDMTQKNVNVKNQEEMQKEEIKAILSQKNIMVSDIRITKENSGRTLVKLYTDVCDSKKIQECKADIIQKVISKVCNQEMILQDNECAIKTERKICNLNYVSQDKYKIQFGIAKATKNKSPISGDSSLQMKLEDGKYLLAISDGMGSGPNARKSSRIATKMLQRLLSSGFQKELSIELINSSICLNSNEDTYATLDIAILDLYKGNIEFIKNGACPTFIKNRKNVDIIKTMSLPAGILDDIDLTVYDRDIDNNDILVMCSDGIIESNAEYENKELWVKYLLENIQTDNVQKIADIILRESIDNGFGIAKDDMTVIVAKIVKK